MKLHTIAFFLVVFALSACTKLPLVNAPREKEGISLVQNAHYDAESKIRYMVSNDNTHVYLRFDTDNYATISRIRQFGAILHYDTQGKKKAPFWFKYPVYDQGNGDRMPIKEGDMIQGGMLQQNLFPKANSAVWHANEESRAIDLLVNAENFVCEAGLDENDVLVYLVGIPMQLLGASRPEDLANLNILLEIPAGPPAEKGSDAGMSASSGVPGGSMASQMPGNTGMNSPGNMGGMSNQAMGTARPSSSGPAAFRIWMQVKLSPTSAE
jgi:hypothetical protein